MAGISLTYNDVELSQWFDITDVQRNLGTAHSNTMVKVGQSDGQLWQYMSRDAKTITVTGIITNANLANLRRELGAAIDTDEPKQLIIGDDSDVYYLAIYDGQPTLAEDWRSGTISLTFIVPDGIAHSVATKTADNMPYKDVPVNLLTGTSNVQDYTMSSSGWNAGSQSKNGNNSTIPCTPGASYAYSAIVKSTTFNCFIELQFFDNNNERMENVISIGGTDIGVRKVAAVAPANSAFMKAHMVLQNPPDSQTVVFNSEKLEEGTTATPWSPNPADPEYYSDTITVQNAGSYKSYPVITATMSGDNGFLGLANSAGGYLEFGDAESPDKVTGTKSDRALWWGYKSEPTGAEINTNCVTSYPYRLNDSKYPNAFDGSLKFGQGSIKEVATPVWASNSDDVWHGPAIHGGVGANINGIRTGYFTFANRVRFQPTKKGFGRVEFNLENSGKSGIAAILRDSDDKSASRNFECIVGTLSDNVRLLKSYVIPSSWKTFLEAKITRKGNTVTWQLSEIDGKHSWRWSTTMAELGAMEITGVTIWPQKYTNDASIDIDLTDTQFTWQNETVVTDIPNLFADGDVVTIDTVSKKILVNGVEDRGLQEIGNHWDEFFLTPGNNTITVDGSSWATQPAITVDYQEAYV